MFVRVVVAAALLIIGVNAKAAASDGAVVASVEPLKVLKGAKLAWPGAPDREAVVILQFDMLATGKIANVRVADGGFHEKRFVDAAIAAAKRITFEPRRIDGQPADALGVTQVYRFDLSLGPGISSGFRRELVKVGELLDKRDFVGANFHAEWMLADIVKFTYEYAVLQAQLAETYARVGKISEAISKAYLATTRTAPIREFLQLQDSVPPNKASYYLLQEAVVVHLLELRMRLLVDQGQYLEAMQSYYELAGLVELKADDPRTVLANEVEAIIKGPSALAGHVEMGDNAWRWVQYLSRQRFTLEKVQGAVKTIRLRCSARPETTLEYKSGVTWRVPAKWVVCVALVDVEPGTSFDFVEFAE